MQCKQRTNQPEQDEDGGQQTVDERPSQLGDWARRPHFPFALPQLLPKSLDENTHHLGVVARPSTPAGAPLVSLRKAPVPSFRRRRTNLLFKFKQRVEMLATPPYHPPAIASPSHVRPSTSPLHPNSSGSSSSGSPAATTSSHGRRTSTSSHSTPADDPADSFVNPVFSIGERVQNGELDEVHLFKVCENDIIIREGTPPSFPHPSTWHEHPHRHVKGKGKGTTLVVGGHGEDGAVERVEDFRDEGIENSKRDALRMTAHEWKAGINEDLGRTQSKGKGRRLSSASHSALDRVPSRESSAATDERAQHPTDDSSTSYFSTASYQNGVAAYSNGSPSTPPRNGAPVVNAPGHPVTNSRAIPSPTSSPVRLIPTGALTKPLHLSASSSLFPPSGSSSTAPLPRRSNTTGSSVPVLSSTVSRSPTRKIVPLRSHSFSQHPQHDSSVAESLYFPTNEGAPKDEVEESIAAQADVIRKERQSKRLEKAQEEEENAKASGSGLSLGRRSTRAGSHAEVGGPGTGVLVGNLIGQDHANYVLMYNMLTGIRIGVSADREEEDEADRVGLRRCRGVRRSSSDRSRMRTILLGTSSRSTCACIPPSEAVGG